MQTVTTKAIAKVAAVATGLAMATSMLSLAPIAHAATLTDSQVQSILSLLSSFGANSATIANVQAALTGQPTTTTTTTTTSSCSFTKDLTLKSSGSDVTCLQNALIAGGYKIAAGATGYFGAQTQSAVIAWQKAAGVSPAAGYFGAKSRAAFNLGGTASTGGTTTTTTGNTTVYTGTGNGLKVSLATDSPNNIALVEGQAIGDLAKFTFANPTGADIKVTNVAFKRTGVSNDETMVNVYLYNGAKRLTDAGSVSSGAFSFNDPTGLFTVPAGKAYTVSVLADILSTASGQQIGAQLVSVTSTGTLDSSVVLPITGATQTVSAATLASVAFSTATLPQSITVDPQTDYTVWQNTVTIGTRAVTLSSLQLKNIGSIAATDITNLRLYVDGVQVGSTASIDSKDNTVTWDLSAAPVRLETGGRVLKVVGDITGGSDSTFQFSLRRASDAQMIDTDLNQPILATGNSSSSTGSFAARAATSATINHGTVSVVKATNSPSSNVSIGASNVKWVSYEMRAAGEDVKIDNLDIEAITTVDHGLDNGKVFLNGIQVGSTHDLTRPAGVTTATNFTFGSSFILKAGATAIVDIYADAKTSTGAAYANGETAYIRLLYTASSANGTGQVSLASIDVPGSNVDGNAITISSSTMTMTKYSGYGNQTLIAGAQSARLGAFTLSTGSTEGVNVNTITVTLSTNEAATVTDIMLKDDATGVQLGSTKSSPTGAGTYASPTGSNSFSVNFNLPANGTKVIDIYGNVKSGSNAGPWVATVDGSGTGATTGNAVTFGSSTTGQLQTITVSSAVLTTAVGVSPNNSIAIAGSSLVKVGSFNFTAQYSPYTVDKIAVKIPANAATSVTSVTLRYPNKSGVSTDSVGVISLSSGATQTYSTSTFTGLSFYIPAGTTKTLDAYVSLASIASGASSGAAVSVVLDKNEGFNATDSSGTATTTFSGGDLDSTATTGKGTVVVRQTVPTISAVALDSTVLTAGSGRTIARFKVTADAAGDVSWGKIAFKIQKTYPITLGATSTIKMYQGSNIVAGVFATTASPGSIVEPEAFPVTNASVSTTDLNLVFLPTSEQTVPAGTSLTYELRANVGNLLAANQNVLDVAIASSNYTSATTDTAANMTLTAATTPTIVWSDRSSQSIVHTGLSGSSVDWTNDYLVNTLPITVGNMTANL